MIPQRHFFKKQSKWLAGVFSESICWPFLRVATRCFTHLSPTPPKTWRRGILLGADHIGDVLYRTSSLAKLREILPDCSWDWAVHAPSDEVLSGNPYILDVVKIEKGTRSRDVSNILRGRQYDVAICYDTGAYEKSLLIALQAGIPNRVAYVHKGLSALVTLPVPIRYPQAYPGYFRDLVAYLGSIPANWDLRPQVFTTSADEIAAEMFLKEHHLDRKPLVACFITSRQPASSIWPASNFLKVIKAVRDTSQAHWILCGSAEDREKLIDFSQALGGNTVICAGDLSLRSLVCLLARCHAVLTTDSGPRHLANAAGAPPVFVRNSLFLPEEAGVYCDREYDFADHALDDQCVSITKKLTDLISSEKRCLPNLNE